MCRAREAILKDEYPAFARGFFQSYFPDDEGPPEWARDALRGVGIEI